MPTIKAVFFLFCRLNRIRDWERIGQRAPRRTGVFQRERWKSAGGFRKRPFTTHEKKNEPTTKSWQSKEWKNSSSLISECIKKRWGYLRRFVGPTRAPMSQTDNQYNTVQFRCVIVVFNRNKSFFFKRRVSLSLRARLCELTTSTLVTSFLFRQNSHHTTLSA